MPETPSRDDDQPEDDRTILAQRANVAPEDDDPDDSTRLSDMTRVARRTPAPAGDPSAQGPQDFTVAVDTGDAESTSRKVNPAPARRTRSALPPGAVTPSVRATHGSFGSSPQKYTKRQLPRNRVQSGQAAEPASVQPDSASAASRVVSPEVATKRRARQQSRRRAIAITVTCVAVAFTAALVAVILNVAGVW